MKLDAGTVLGWYTIRELIGSGAMGEVYRAHDDRLKRDVAIKVLPDELASDEAALARFEREAQSVAALSHPNIVTVHDVGRDGGISYVVLELLHGETLRARIERDEVPRREAIDIARQIVNGLAAAHDRGIVHRDLKPENLFVTRDGLVKILDFGLAKPGVAPTGGGSDSALPTLGHSTPGVAVGTLAYMSPEQVRGHPADQRADIFAVGVVLYEMLAGEKPHAGSSSADLIGAILRDPPRDLTTIDRPVSPALWRVVQRCLHKEPRHRFQTAHDLAFALGSPALEDDGDRSTGDRRRPPGPAPAPTSVAVLPFRDMGPDPDQEFLCEGVAEEIINALGGVSGLRVAARSSTFRLDPTTHDARQAGAALNVDTVLEGSIRRADRRLRVTVQLVDADSGFTLWSERYDTTIGDVFELQDEIAGQIVGKMKIELGAEERRELKRPTASVEAYQLYLRGLHHWYRRERDSLATAASYFERAAAEDPDYTLAFSGIASAYTSMAIFGFDPRVAKPKAERALARARELDPELAQVRLAAGYKHIFLDWDYPRAEREIQAAIDTNPNNAIALIWMTFICGAARQRRDEGVRLAMRARDLDPLSPYTQALTGNALLWAGRPRQAHQVLHQALDLDRDYLLTLWELAAAAGILGRFDEAVELCEHAVELSDRSPFYLGWLGWAHGCAGHRQRAREILAELTEKPGDDYVPPLGPVQIHTALGDLDRAFEWLERAVEVGDPMACHFAMPYMLALEKDPRLDVIRARVGGPDAVELVDE